MSDYQNMILNEMGKGARLQSSEGVNYKTWLVYPDGKIKNIIRTSAVKFSNENERLLEFGDSKGIKLRRIKNV